MELHEQGHHQVSPLRQIQPRSGCRRGPAALRELHRLLPWVAEAGDDDFGEIAERSAVPVMVDFWAVWCGPCRMVSPVLDQLAHERAGQIKLVKVDVVHSPQLSARFAIQAVPTLMVVVDGKIVARQAGAAPAPVLRSWLDGALRK